MPSGLSPRGAASFYTLGWGSGDPRWNGLQSTGSLPHTCSQPPVVPRVPSPRGVEIAFLAGSHGASSLPLVALGYEHGGWRRECVVRSSGFGELGLGGQQAQQRYPLPPLTKFPYLNEERRRRR